MQYDATKHIIPSQSILYVPPDQSLKAAPTIFFYNTRTVLGHYGFLSVLNERAHLIQAAHYRKKVCFFCPARTLDCCRSAGDKKHSEKEQVYFRR